MSADHPDTAPTDDRDRKPAFAGKTVFVTGGTGFLGSHLVEGLLHAGAATVRCLVRTEPKWLKGLPVEFVSGDLHDRPALERGVRGADMVFHVAALTRARSWKVFEHANVTGTTRLLESIAETNPAIDRVVLTSSLAVVGRAGTKIADENTPLDPVSMYGRSKLLMEQAARKWSDRIDLIIVRPPAVYGPRETDIYSFFRTMKFGLCPIVGSRDEQLSLVHVDDVVRGLIAAALSPGASGRTYFIGPAEQAAWREVRDAVRHATGRIAVTVPVPRSLVRSIGAVIETLARPFGVYPPLNREKAEEITEACLMCDSSRAIREIGYRPSVDLESGIRRTIEWYRGHGWL